MGYLLFHSLSSLWGGTVCLPRLTASGRDPKIGVPPLVPSEGVSTPWLCRHTSGAFSISILMVALEKCRNMPYTRWQAVPLYATVAGVDSGSV